MPAAVILATPKKSGGEPGEERPRVEEPPTNHDWDGLQDKGRRRSIGENATANRKEAQRLARLSAGVIKLQPQEHGDE